MAASPLSADKGYAAGGGLIDVDEIDYQLITDRDALAQFLAAAGHRAFFALIQKPLD